MQQKYAINHSIHVFTVGEYASGHIPRIDRASTDLQWLPCDIIQVIRKRQRIYRIRSKHGVLHTCFHASDLEPFAGTYSIPTSGWRNDKKITLCEAARLQLPWNAFTKNQYNCKPGTCNSRRCKLQEDRN